MRLTREEEAMLGGSEGPAVAWAMEQLVKLGEFFDAEGLVDVAGAHITDDAGQLNRWGLALVKKLLSQGARFKVPTTTNCIGVDFENWRRLHVDLEALEEQRGVSNLLLQMGAIPTHTQAVYLTGPFPRLGQHLAYSESEAVTYANSCFGARTNLEGYTSAMLAALTGKTPKYGFHLDENRRGNVVVDVKADLKELSDWDVLGFVVGHALRRYDKVPVFVNLPPGTTNDNLKHMSSALPTTGSICIFHAVGITPEAPTLQKALGGKKAVEKLAVDRGAIDEIYDQFSGEGRVDMIWFGSSPPLSIEELRLITEQFRGRKVHKGLEVWLFAPETAKVMADRMGLTRALEELGCKLFAHSTPLIIAGAQFRKFISGKTILCDSMKTCWYGDTFIAGSQPTKFVLRSIRDCVATAVAGRPSR